MGRPPKDGKHLAKREGIMLPDEAPSLVRGASIWDEADEDSIVRKTVGDLKNAILINGKTPEARKFLRHGEDYIRDNLKPTPTMARLRISFWDEYARALDQGSLMVTERIYAGIMSRELFDQDFLCSPSMIGYLLSTPPHYHRAAEEILLLGLERMRDIIELPLIDSKGRVQGAVLSAVIKAVELLDKRVKGAILQKIAVHQHSTSGAQPLPVAESGSAKDELTLISEEVDRLREKLSASFVKLPNYGDHNPAATFVEKVVRDAKET